MKILQLLLLFYFAYSSHAIADPLVRIEEKLAVRLMELKEFTPPEEQTSPIEITDAINDDPFSVVTAATDVFDFDITASISDDFEHPYSVQVGASRSQKLSYRVASMLRELDYPAFNSSIDLGARGIWYRVYIGAFATRDKAQEIKEQLQREDIAEGFLRHLPYGVQVGNSGSYQQLELLHNRLLDSAFHPYSTPIRNASSDRIEGRLLVGACYQKEDCDLLLSTLATQGFSGVIIER